MSDKKHVADAVASQLFTMTNILRKRYSLDSLQHNKILDRMSRLQSKHMAFTDSSIQDKVSHQLLSALYDQDLSFVSFGSNVAMSAPDGISAFFYWLNHKQGRQDLLSVAFNQLGTGVYHGYYTQIFMDAPLRKED